MKQMKNLKKLSRQDLKDIFGGKLNPYSNDVYASGDESEGKYYKCCSNNSDACNSCVYIKGNPVCITGSYPVAC